MGSSGGGGPPFRATQQSQPVERHQDGLAELAGTSPTAVSQHLSKLRLAGLVTNRREGAFIYYALADHHIGEMVRQALSHADHRTGRAQSSQHVGAEAAHPE
jgi:DNA-binding transcriptional ArsR family regulator